MLVPVFSGGSYEEYFKFIVFSRGVPNAAKLENLISAYDSYAKNGTFEVM